MTGDEFASIVHAMLLDLEKAVSIPLSSAAPRRATTAHSRTVTRELDVELNLMS